MNSEYIFVAAIFIYVLFEYQKREQLHREKIELLKNDLEPLPVIKSPTFASLLSTSLVGIVLAAVNIVYAALILSPRSRFNIFIIIIFVFLFGINVIIGAILRRDIKKYITNRRARI